MIGRLLEAGAMKTLEGKVALVAGATRGAGRGIACMLGEACDEPFYEYWRDGILEILFPDWP